jgi:hypothetical protein
MAGIALILTYQWRAFWRRFIRTRHRAQFYLTVLTVLVWAFVTILPERLSSAAQELSAGQTTSMDGVLWTFSVLWLFVLVEDANVSLTTRHLRTFPIDTRRLLLVRMLSVFCSPVALLIACGSVFSLWPLLLARQTILGTIAALLLFALALACAMCASTVLSVARLRRTVLAPMAVISIVLGAVFLTQGVQGVAPLRTVAAVTPAHLVSAVSIAATASAAIAPLTTLVVMNAVVCALLLWSFRRSVFVEPGKRAAGRGVDRVLWFPGRFGGLMRMEQHYLRKLLDVWPGLLLVLAFSVASLFGPLPPIVGQSIIVIVFFFNTNMIMNCFGLNTSAELNRYAILPLRGKEVLLVKNLGLTVIVAVQLALLIPVAVWRSGLFEAGTDVLAAAVLLLAHLTWGNLVSVTAPFKMTFYRFASNGAPLTVMVGGTIGSTPGIVVLSLLQSESSFSSAAAIAGVLLLSVIAYLVSLHWSGRRFEHRRHIIAERLLLTI